MGGVSGTGGPSGTGYMARAATPPKQSHIYQPTYGNYTSPMNQAVYGVASGLGATPQYTQFQAQMPTFSRPEMAPPPPSGGFGRFPMQALSPQPAYRIPYNPPSQQQQLMNRALNSPFLLSMRRTPEQQATSLNKAIQNNNLTYAQYEQMMAKPDLYLPHVQAVQAGNAPTTVGYQQRPIQYMTAGQRKAYNDAQSRQLSELLGPAPADPSASNSDGA